MSKIVNKEIKLSPKQIQAMEALKQPTVNEVLYGGSAGSGKTRLGVLWLIMQCFTYPGSRWVMGRAVLQRLKETSLRSFFDVTRELGIATPAGKYYNFNQQNNTISFYNGSEIILKDLSKQPSDPMYDSLGSLEITGAFIDECAEVDQMAKNVLMSRIRYRLDEFGLTPKLLGTTNPSKNWTYHEFYKPAQNGELAPHRRFIPALPMDNPWLPQSYIESFNNQPKSIRDRLFHGKWEIEDDPMALMTFDDIVHAFDNRSILIVNDGQILGTSCNGVEDTDAYITVDVARLGDDKTVIVLWRGLAAVEFQTLEKKTTDVTVGIVRDLQQKHGVIAKNIIVDSDGVGSGVVDQLRGCTSFVNNARAINEENYSNVKSQCYHALADAVTRHEIYVGCEFTKRNTIIEEFEQVRRGRGDDLKRVSVVGKDEVKKTLGRSPDYSDAIMLRMHHEVKKRKKKYSSFDSVSVITW